MREGGREGDLLLVLHLCFEGDGGTNNRSTEQVGSVHRRLSTHALWLIQGAEGA